jgi:uncharacterized membrane protein YkvA (DUF1232 family)
MSRARWVRRAQAAKLATTLLALWKLFRHPSTPRAVRWLAFAVLAYVASPIDLIPDFIPVLGCLDELVLVPLGVALVVRLTPRPLWARCLAEAAASRERQPRLLWGAVAIVASWTIALGWLAWWMIGMMGQARA